MHETYLVLTETVKELETQVAVMKRSETDLMDIASHQEFTFDEVIDMVIENNMTVEKQKVTIMTYELMLIHYSVDAYTSNFEHHAHQDELPSNCSLFCSRNILPWR